MQKILKIKECDVNRGWNGPISLSQKVKKTCSNKGYRKVQLNGVIYSVDTKWVGIGNMSIAWLGAKIGELNTLGHFIGVTK